MNFPTAAPAHIEEAADEIIETLRDLKKLDRLIVQEITSHGVTEGTSFVKTMGWYQTLNAYHIALDSVPDDVPNPKLVKMPAEISITDGALLALALSGIAKQYGIIASRISPVGPEFGLLRSAEWRRTDTSKDRYVLALLTQFDSGNRLDTHRLTSPTSAA